MNDQRNLTFPDDNAHHISARMVVMFTGRDANKAIACAISDEALKDHFGRKI